MTGTPRTGTRRRLLARPLKPRALRSLVLLAFLVVALPLVGAVTYAAQSSERLARASERLVSRSVQITATGEDLKALTMEMERSARQLWITRSLELRGVYESRHDAVLTALRSLDALRPSPIDASQLERLRQAVAELDAIVRAGASDAAAARSLSDAFDTVRAEVDAIQDMGGERIERSLQALVEDQRDTSRALIALSAGLAIATVLLAFGFTALISRPINAVVAAIHRLGEGHTDAPIAISGPRDLEKVGDEIEWLRTELNRLDEERKGFLQEVSHELKTPLASIVEATRLLTDGAVDANPDVRGNVMHILTRNVDRLHRRIDRLLDFTAWQAKNSSVVARAVDLRTLIQSVARDHHLAMEARGVELHLEIPGGFTINADPHRMRMVFDNLLSNAIKFSPAGGAISVRAECRDHTFRVDFEDEGPGIPACEKGRVFEPFFQGGVRAQSRVTGTGIGLSIVRACVVAHGGTIQVLGDRSVGAHFRIELPTDALT